MAPFSATLLDHFRQPRQTGRLPSPSGEGWGGDPHSSRYLFIQVLLDGNRLADARFGTYGCAPAIACGSFLCERTVGRTISDALAYTADQLADDLGGLPPGRRFCAGLAVDALRAAILDALKPIRETVL